MNPNSHHRPASRSEKTVATSRSLEDDATAAIPIQLESTRRELLASCCAVFVAGRSAWTAEQQVPADAILSAIATRMLPLGDPRFPPIPAGQIVARARGLFVTNSEARQRLDFALSFFNSLQTFEDPATMRRPSGISDAQWQRTISTELETAQSFLADLPPQAKQFLDLGEQQATGYVKLWARSQLVHRRRFFRSTKSMIMVSAYTLEPVWESIGYPGPVLGRMP